MRNETDAGDNARDGREEASSDNSSDSDLDYWERQLQAALESMEPETRTTQRHNAEDVVVVIVGDSGREERAELTHALERCGFEIVSTTTEEYVRVDATADRLEHPFADPDVRTDGGQLRRCAAKGCTEPMDHLIHGVVLDGTTFEVPTCGGHEDLSNDSPEVRADGGRGSVTDKWHRRCPNGHELHIHADECPRCGSEETAGRALPDGGGVTELNGVALTGLDAAEEALVYLTDDYNRGELHRGDGGETLVVISRGRSFQHFDLFRKARRLSVSNPRAVDVGEEESDIRLKVELREKASAGVGVTEVGP
jgi:hypothetical protein